MQAKKVFFATFPCRCDVIRYLSQSKLDSLGPDGNPRIFSIVGENNVEKNIYLTRDTRTDEYVVIVMKPSPAVSYVRHRYDKVKRIAENNFMSKFYFNKFDNAIEFLVALPFYHHEFDKDRVSMRHLLY